MKSPIFFLQRFLILIGLAFSSLFSHADIPEPLLPPRLVNDFASLFSIEEIQGLENRLRQYRDTTSTEIAVVTVSDLEGYDVADYANRLAEKWGVGDKKKDNGVLVLISTSPRKVTIQTGYGVEEKLPDIVCSRIIRERIRPYFKQQQFAAGIHAALDEMEQRLAGTWQSEPETDDSTPIYVYLIIFFIFFFFLFGRFNRHSSATFGGRGYRSYTPPLWFPGRSGGGFSGGSGGSSFGGFGGGSFGGGGASGDW